MTTPALRSLKKRFPKAEIHLLVQPGVAPLARGFSDSGKIHFLFCGFIIGGKNKLGGAFAWISKLLELRKNTYDMVIDFTGLFHSAAAT